MSGMCLGCGWLADTANTDHELGKRGHGHKERRKNPMYYLSIIEAMELDEIAGDSRETREVRKELCMKP